MAFKIEWDAPEQREYQTGVDRGVLYPMTANGYGAGVPWNGLTAVNENPSGADATELWADNIKYLSIRAAEKFGLTIEAYTYPEEFEQCDGSATPVSGVSVGQQSRKAFGLSYRTVVGNSVELNDYGYKIHLVYGATASPSSRNYQTINDSPEAITFSWECETTPVAVKDLKPTSSIIIDSTKVPAEKLTTLENMLYGSGTTDAALPLPDAVIAIFKNN